MGPLYVVILAPFGEIGLSFSVYNIFKNYLTSDDVWTKALSHNKFGVFSSSVSHLIIQHISYNTVFMYMSSTCSGNNVQLSQHHKWGFEAKGLK